MPACTLGCETPVHVCWVEPITAYNSASRYDKGACILSHDSRRKEIEAETTNTPQTWSGRRWIEDPGLRHSRLRPRSDPGEIASTASNTAKAGVMKYIEPSDHRGCRCQGVCVKVGFTSELDISGYCSGLSLLTEEGATEYSGRQNCEYCFW